MLDFSKLVSWGFCHPRLFGVYIWCGLPFRELLGCKYFCLLIGVFLSLLFRLFGVKSNMYEWGYLWYGRVLFDRFILLINCFFLWMIWWHLFLLDVFLKHVCYMCNIFLYDFPLWVISFYYFLQFRWIYRNHMLFVRYIFFGRLL